MINDPMINDTWLKTSIMATRGLAKGEAGKRHELSIEAQGAFHYVYGPYAKPVLTIDPGDVVVVETEDAFGGVITSEQDSPTAKLRFPFLNPQCGPVAVSGVDYGFDEIDAYMLLSQAGRIRLGNVVDPKYTMGASVLKKYLGAVRNVVGIRC